MTYGEPWRAGTETLISSTVHAQLVAWMLQDGIQLIELGGAASPGPQSGPAGGPTPGPRAAPGPQGGPEGGPTPGPRAARGPVADVASVAAASSLWMP